MNPVEGFDPEGARASSEKEKKQKHQEALSLAKQENASRVELMLEEAKTLTTGLTELDPEPGRVALYRKLYDILEAIGHDPAEEGALYTSVSREANGIRFNQFDLFQKVDPEGVPGQEI
jgi:hypothetical protein